jgi:uncharacterized protein (DUF1810 family)
VAEGLDRFIKAQDQLYPRILKELRNGEKRSHWMWFVFPQLVELGRSQMARFYGIAGIEEARAYLAHPILGPRLIECTEAMLGWTGKKSAVAILGDVDALKFASSMTLFEAAGGGVEFTEALHGFYVGIRDARTLALFD